MPAVPLTVVLGLLVLAMLWGSAFPLIKVGLEGLSAPSLTLFRFLVASSCFAAYLYLVRARLLPDLRDVPFFLLLGFLGITVYHLALNFGELFVTAGAASLIIATAPALSAVVAYFVIGERLRPLGWAGISIAFGGVALIVLGDDPELGFNPYALLILLSAVVTAFFAVLQTRLFDRYRAVEVSGFATWAGTLPLLVFLPAFPGDVGNAGTAPILAAVYIGIFPAAVAYALFSFALSRAPVTLVTTYLYTVPLFSLLFSWLLLGEVPSRLTAVGGAAVIAGIATVNRAKLARRAPGPDRSGDG